MRRRALLATVGSGLLAGCTLSVDAPKRDVPDDPGCRPLSRFRVGDRTATVLPRFDAGEATANASITSPATATSPAVVTVTVSNETKHLVEPLHLDWWLRPPPATVDGERLHLLPAAGHPLADADPNVERTPGGHWRARELPGRDVSVDGRLAAGETIEAPFHLVLGPNSSAFPPGNYRFGSPTVLSLVAWETSSPGPDSDSRFDSPALPAAVEDARWFHRADRTTESYLVPSAERVSGSSVTFSLVNRSRECLTGNEYDWRLYRRTVDGWREYGPDVVRQASTSMPPGTTHGWRFAVADEHVDDPPPLGSGEYAFVTDLSRNGRLHATRFDVATD